ncbi:GAF domain-containing protein [Ktedonosporobacter rubrisoli]|uniref:GAF domain-containing protein n=1 Tax=Ktedonosporobacter rubrisoli TaxID=2509675 RepID=A0A4P6JVW4_KTERU|nr:GAF domain-containing protein [Ktedonosporobacter rubrisoli]QBD79819.1 GAF domain-containing protein [Ktedonosporobacter rubrisoli]
MENGPETGEHPKKRRGRPPGTWRTSSPSRSKRGKEDRTEQQTANLNNSQSARDTGELTEERPAAARQHEPFSGLLHSILQQDRTEIARVARTLDIAENTIYRWMNGTSAPRIHLLKKLPDVLVEQRRELIQAINQAFPGTFDTLALGIGEVGKDIYCHILELVATIEDEDIRFWQCAQTLFEHALQLLDVERHGISITYARLMPPWPDGIHSLREFHMLGSAPWPHNSESRGYLGSTTLAAASISSQHRQTWDITDKENRLQVEVDEHEESACAVPVVRGGRVAGVLIISCAHSGFFKDAMACRAVEEYALLLATALRDIDFQPYERLNLRPMLPLKWQRERIRQTYNQNILIYARAHGVSRTEAESYVQHTFEEEFERRAPDIAGQRRIAEKLPGAVKPYSATSSGQG